jgi:glycosyltransferase involved in cell wall biosynthesis
MIDWLSKKVPAPFIIIFDVFLLTTVSEGMQMTTLESMNIRRPCTVTNLGGNAVVVTHEQNGLVLENDNLARRTNAIVSLAN